MVQTSNHLISTAGKVPTNASQAISHLVIYYCVKSHTMKAKIMSSGSTRIKRYNSPFPFKVHGETRKRGLIEVLSGINSLHLI